MKELIEIFRMDELSKENRVRLIIKMGILINNQYGGNITEAVVYELVKLLDPNNNILKDPHYMHYAGVHPQEPTNDQ